MKPRISFVLAACVAVATLTTTANADIKKGQKAYLKTCKKCHGNGTKGAAMKTQAQWAAAFENDARIFKQWHKNDPKANKFVHSKKFRKYAPHLKDFLYNYASDSGNVPSCG